MTALIFDIDGTFSETEEVHRQAFNETFAAHELGWWWDRPTYKKLLDVTGGKERIRHFIDTHDPVHGGATIERIPELHADKTVRYAALIDAGAASLRPGVERLIREAKMAGVPVAIATTTSLPNVEALVRATLGPEGMALFDVVGAGDIIAKKKPHPDIYLWVLEQLDLEARDALAFEDSVNGLRSANAAGLATIITPSVYTDDQTFEGALSVVSDLGEPEKPYRHVAGRGEGQGIVDLPAVRRWIGEARLVESRR